MNKRFYYPGDQFVIESIVRDPNWSMSYLHYHDFYELYFLEKGRHSTLVGDKLFHLEEHDVALYMPNVLHKSHETHGYTRTCIYFSREFLEKYFQARAIDLMTECFQRQVISLDNETYASIQHYFPLLYSENVHDEYNRIFIYLADILNILNQHKNSPHTAQLTPEERKLSAILQYINENYNTIDSIEAIAQKHYINKYYLCRIFKSATGLTLIEYLNQVKIQHARDMLKNTDKSIITIAMDCGFNSSMYFCKTFKKLLHMTPTEFRKQEAIKKQ